MSVFDFRYLFKYVKLGLAFKQLPWYYSSVKCDFSILESLFVSPDYITYYVIIKL